MLNDKIETILKRDLNNATRLSEAVAEIEVAFAASLENASTPEQLGDLADAIDAFKDRDYGVAAALARAASGPRRQVQFSRRPDSMSQSIVELREAFARYRQEHGA